MEALNDIFSNIQAIHQLHRDFLLPKLEARMKEWYDALYLLSCFSIPHLIYQYNIIEETELLSVTQAP